MLLCPLREIQVALSGYGTAAAKSSATHFYQCVQYFSCVQTMVWLPVFGNFNVRTDVDACDCTRGMCGHRKRVRTESRLWEKNPLPHRGLGQTHVSTAPGFPSDTLPTGLPPPPLSASNPLMICSGFPTGNGSEAGKSLPSLALEGYTLTFSRLSFSYFNLLTYIVSMIILRSV